MIEVFLTKELIEKSKIESEKIPITKNSILEGAGRHTGIVGQYAAQQVYGGVMTDQYNFDLLDRNIRSEVKSKNIYKSNIIRPYYCCPIPSYNIQECDRYIFVRVNMMQYRAFVCGSIPFHEFYKKAVFVKKGGKDPFDSNSPFVMSCDCWNVKVSDLIPPQQKAVKDKIDLFF